MIFPFEITESRIFCAYWCLMGFSLGMVFTDILNNKTIKKLRKQRIDFIEMIAKLSVKYSKLNYIAAKLVTINQIILNKR